MTAYAQIGIPAPAPNQSLPLSLSGFTAQLQGGKVTLYWSTDMDMHADYFTIQRSTDGNRYDDAGMVFTQGQGISHREYNFSDDVGNLPVSLIYYRLKMTDLDGRYNYSPVVQVRLGRSTETGWLPVYPNPAYRELRVTIPEGWQNQTIRYIIYNLDGVSIYEKTSRKAGQTETIPVGDLPPGIYLIRTANGNQTAVQKFIKASG